MRKFISVAFLVLIVFIKINAQEASVEKSVFGLQIGTNPWNIYYEGKLADKLSLHTEVGLGGEFIWQNGENGYMIQPNISVEPRYYYNLDRRVSKGKKIAGNTGNYIGMMLDYIPDLYINKSTSSRWTGVVAMPSYGIQRRVGKWFEYELGFGMGYQWGKDKNEYYPLYWSIPDAPLVKTTTTNNRLVYSIRLGIGIGF